MYDDVGIRPAAARQKRQTSTYNPDPTNSYSQLPKQQQQQPTTFSFATASHDPSDLVGQSSDDVDLASGFDLQPNAYNHLAFEGDLPDQNYNVVQTEVESVLPSRGYQALTAVPTDIYDYNNNQTNVEPNPLMVPQYENIKDTMTSLEDSYRQNDGLDGHYDA
jgi:hypothetical protein